VPVTAAPVPRQPSALARGLCASGRYPPDWWCSDTGTAREQRDAIALCGSCPVVAECREWGLSLPSYSNTVILGGMTPAGRHREKRARAAKAAARLKAQRQSRRNSEKLRRMLGKAPTGAQRYAANPEASKRRAAAWYEAHREEVRAKRRAERAQRRAAAQSAA
jgi:Transcription factor WhiB